jgi:hypothetical protein
MLIHRLAVCKKEKKKKKKKKKKKTDGCISKEEEFDSVLNELGIEDQVLGMMPLE